MDELGADAQSAEGIRRLIENKSFAALGDALEPFKGCLLYTSRCV